MCWYDFLYIGRTTESTRNHVIFLRNLFKYVFVFVLIFLLESIEINRFFTRHEQIWIIFLTMTTSIGAKSQEIEHQKKKTKTLHQQYIVRCKMRINWRICFCLNFSLRKEKLNSEAWAAMIYFGGWNAVCHITNNEKCLIEPFFSDLNKPPQCICNRCGGHCALGSVSFRFMFVSHLFQLIV